jgi:sterol desaturase/sphingolipid hydroxylase (fatty acid hydroxylase superfamily)
VIILENQAFLRVGLFSMCFFLLVFVEFRSPLVRHREMWTINRLTNLLFLLSTVGMSRLLISMSAVSAAIFAQSNQFGFFNVFPVHAGVSFVITLILLDFLIYLQHRAMHAVPFLWRFHQIHHADERLDITTGFRFHPGEIFFSMIYKWLIVCLMGPSIAAVVVFEIILNSFSLFTHSNSKLPSRCQAALEAIFITPQIHWIHHSIRLFESQKNFGFCLCLWDRLFKTYTHYPLVEVTRLKFGVADMNARQNNFKDMLLHPFRNMHGLNYLLGRREGD